MPTVFVTGGTGFMGRNLIAELLRRGYTIRALARHGSEHKLPHGAVVVPGDALDKNSFAAQIPPAETFVQLIGVTHPNPSKKDEFRAVDLASARAAIEAARAAGVAHFVYVSVAQPAPVMKDYIAVRAEVEQMIRDSGLNATILRPWYVLGPGRRWPLLLKPMYWLMEQVPSTRESARRLGLVTREQMIAALVQAVENPAQGVRILGVPEIRGARGG
ncbi:MAG TPA: NAD(P)H-binding protein [Candidatus Acidoferrales bacterium]|nr:NAD(P)H-binding protein [Candidatus Acidoferrales bacterium]